MEYHRITRNDCVTVASTAEVLVLQHITPMDLLRELAQRWCTKHGYKLGGYLGAKD